MESSDTEKPTHARKVLSSYKKQIKMARGKVWSK
jgi:hypothetical protein